MRASKTNLEQRHVRHENRRRSNEKANQYLREIATDEQAKQTLNKDMEQMTTDEHASKQQIKI